ncbi:hypothetical protein PVPAM_130018000 [Plasmodium vivax]|nr:hypothetical protein PVPAM_130018000 [Plasmodium vivax]
MTWMTCTSGLPTSPHLRCNLRLGGQDEATAVVKRGSRARPTDRVTLPCVVTPRGGVAQGPPLHSLQKLKHNSDGLFLKEKK